MLKKELFTACALAIATGLGSVPANAGTVSFEVGQIVRLREYVSFGNGDVIVYTQKTSAGCDGFWFRTTEVNGKEIFAHLLTARVTQTPMSFTVLDDQMWSGTSSRFCKVYSVGET